jgi:FtsP/CotA-like multicopper oxidase with cupredoxin domain
MMAYRESPSVSNKQDKKTYRTIGPIPPGGSFTYRFRATRYGTSWYHSHFSLQYSEGLIGPIVINGPTSANWDVDLGAVFVQDWFYTPAFQAWFAFRSHPPLRADTGLINGSNKNGTLGKYTEFVFTPGKKYLMRIINTSTDQHFKFSIDQHTMTVTSADFIPIMPYNQTVLEIGIGISQVEFVLTKGQRYNVIFEANQEVDNYWMRAIPATDCCSNFNADGIRAIVRYEGVTDNTTDPTSTPFNITSTECKDETGLIPVVPKNVGPLSYGEEMNLAIDQTSTYVMFTLNGSSLFIDWDNPTLIMVENGDPSYPGDYNVISVNGTSDTVCSRLSKV